MKTKRDKSPAVKKLEHARKAIKKGHGKGKGGAHLRRVIGNVNKELNLQHIVVVEDIREIAEEDFSYLSEE